MENPTELRYTSSHEWVRRESDGTLTVGITFHAQDALGELVYVELPDAGRTVKQGEACVVVGWLFRMRPSDPPQLDALLDAAQYTAGPAAE